MDIASLVEWYDRDKGYFEYDEDALLSKSIILRPGRFYILHYKPELNTDKLYNTRPIIISLGLSKKDPESFLCIDLCILPYKYRLKFVQMFFDMFKKSINDNIKIAQTINDADEQKEILEFNYANLMKIDRIYPIKNAIKRYKIKNTLKIYSLLYGDVYKVIGKFGDENWFLNGNISDAQKEFIKKSKII